MITNEYEQATYLEAVANTELAVKLTWAQCNLIDALIQLARNTGDLAEYDGDLTAIEHAITDAMVSNVESGLDSEPCHGYLGPGVRCPLCGAEG